MKKILYFLVFFPFVWVSAQNYRYVVLPETFSFFNEHNKYGLHDVSKAFFQSQGFEVYYDNQVLPTELNNNRCSVLFANPVENNSLLLTKIHFEIKDCTNAVVLKGEMATSREKDLQLAYSQTFRTALTSLKENIKTLKTIEESSAKPVANASTTASSATSAILISEKKLFAIPTSNGYKIVNEIPEVLYVLQKTSVQNVFIAQKGSANGIVIKKESSYFFEYYEANQLKSEAIVVQF